MIAWTRYYSSSYAAGSRGGPQVCQRPPPTKDEVLTSQISLREVYTAICSGDAGLA